jgi:hypothetical protein
MMLLGQQNQKNDQAEVPEQNSDHQKQPLVSRSRFEPDGFYRVSVNHLKHS